MANVTTVGQLLINRALPDEMKRESYDLDNKGIQNLFREVAEKHPDRYKEVLHELMKIGTYSITTKGHSVSLSSTKMSAQTRLAMQQLKDRVKAISENDSYSDNMKEKKIVELISKAMPLIRDNLMEEGIANDNPLAMQARSGSRGNANQLQQIMVGDGLVVDHRDRVIGIPILHGYADGLDPVEYFAGSYGARKGSVCLHGSTLVKMADGSNREIRHIKVGDSVLGCDMYGTVAPTKVTRFYDQGTQSCFEWTLKNKKGNQVKVICTSEHKFLTAVKDESQAGGVLVLVNKKLAIGSTTARAKYSLLCIQGEDFGSETCAAPMRLIGKRYLGEDKTFDIEVEHPDHLFVLSNGLISENSTKFATQDAGFFTKQMAQAAHRLVVTEQDCGTTSGIPVSGEDKDNIGAVLAQDVGGYKAGTVITADIAKKLGKEPVYVRSVITCAATSGICAVCAGKREKGKFPSIGDNIGMAAAQSIGEKLSQGMLCLEENTLVRMADNSTKAIKDIVIGDMVLGADINAKTFPVKVLNVFDNGAKECFASEFLGCDDKYITVNCTSTHKFLTIPRIFRNPHKAIHIEFSQQPLADIFNDKCSALIALADEIQMVSYVETEYLGYRKTFDIEVDHPDHLFVLANGLIVSNSNKHTGGQAGVGPSKSGFDYINQLVQVPDNFAGEATVSEIEGKVRAIIDAPQGGKFVTVNDKDYYVPGDQSVIVKEGDAIEPGDVLSNGTPNPAKIVEHKGIGEGRRYFIELFNAGLKNTSINAHRRNLEAISRGLINHIQVTDPDGYGSFLADDIVPFSDFMKSWKPREDSADTRIESSVGKYLDKPVLHYTVGTKITPRMAANMKSYKVNSVFANPAPPPFQPYVVRAMESALRDPDWQTRMYGSFLRKGFEEAVHRGRTSELKSTSFVPGMAAADTFGKDLSTKGLY